MALDQSALLEVLEMLKGGDVEEQVRQAATTIYQALIEAELTAVIGAAPHERSPERDVVRVRLSAVDTVNHRTAKEKAKPNRAPGEIEVFHPAY